MATGPCLALAFVSIEQRIAKRAHRIGIADGLADGGAKRKILPEYTELRSSYWIPKNAR